MATFARSIYCHVGTWTERPMRYSELAASPTGQGGPIVDYDSIVLRFVQGRGKIAGSANGATPDAIDNNANPTRMIAAQTTKVMSVRFF
jgi:hypothetical protein